MQFAFWRAAALDTLVVYAHGVDNAQICRSGNVNINCPKTAQFQVVCHVSNDVRIYIIFYVLSLVYSSIQLFSCNSVK